MTPNEFKAWFDGYSESIECSPSIKQWKRIKARVAEIDGRPTSYPVYVDRYRDALRPSWQYPYYGTAISSAQNLVTQLDPTAQGILYNRSSFNSLSALNLVGQADAKADAA